MNNFPAPVDWRDFPPRAQFYVPVLPRPSFKSLILAVALFLVTLCTCLAAGTQFATAYAHNQAVSLDDFLRAFTLFYKNPAALLAGLPFAATLLTILLAHELGHFFACRHHHIHSSYPFFIPFPSLIGTFGAFILMRSPIRTTRALFDVGLAFERRSLRVCHGWKPRSLCDAEPAHGKALKQAAGADAGPLRATVGWYG